MLGSLFLFLFKTDLFFFSLFAKMTLVVINQHMLLCIILWLLMVIWFFCFLRLSGFIGMSDITSWVCFITQLFFSGFPLHSAPPSTTSSTINVDFDAVFGGKSTAPEYRTANGKNCLMTNLYPTGNSCLTIQHNCYWSWKFNNLIYLQGDYGLIRGNQFSSSYLL